jgi:membrane protease YdiL (CAAX protease family)
VPFVFVNLWEETAWTGFMQHAIQEGRGPLLASVIVAPFFALIHMPGFFVAGFISDEKTPLSQFPSGLRSCPRRGASDRGRRNDGRSTEGTVTPA